jgi:CDP-diacylglycerol---serine O-phosphatidyltransferase
MDRLPRKVRPELQLIQLIPNLMTLGAIAAGMTAIRFAEADRFQWAIALILIAAALDGIDGRIARLLKSESAIGAELDSLADFLNFGVAPAIILYNWGLEGTAGRADGWIAALIYANCCVLRLARFNVGTKGDDKPDPRFFTGIPSPAGGILVMFPIYLSVLFPDIVPIHDKVVGAWMLFVGGLMISQVPTFSFKKTTVYAENARFVMVAAVAALSLLLTYPWFSLTLFCAIYLFTIPFSLRAQRRSAPSPEKPDGT